MFNPGMIGGGMPQMLSRGIGGPGAGPGPMIPQQLMPQMQPGASPEAAMMGGGINGMDPRILAYIKALGGGGMMGGLR